MSSFDATPLTWQFTNVIQQHNSQVIEAAHRYSDIDVVVQSASSPHYSGDVDATTCNATDTCNVTSTRSCAPCPHNCTPCVYRCVDSSPHCATTTSYTGLVQLDKDTLLLAYDRLANGWSAAPGKLGPSDCVSTTCMTVKIAKATGS